MGLKINKNTKIEDDDINIKEVKLIKVDCRSFGNMHEIYWIPDDIIVFKMRISYIKLSTGENIYDYNGRMMGYMVKTEKTTRYAIEKRKKEIETDVMNNVSTLSELNEIIQKYLRELREILPEHGGKYCIND